MAEKVDSLGEIFYARLSTSTNPGVVLSQFYKALLNAEVGRSEIIKFNMLVKIFGKTSVFFAIIDISRRESFPEFPYGLLFKICKDRLEATLTDTEITSTAYQSLERRINEIQKDILNTKKIDPEKVSAKYLDDKKEDD